MSMMYVRYQGRTPYQRESRLGAESDVHVRRMELYSGQHGARAEAALRAMRHSLPVKSTK